MLTPSHFCLADIFLSLAKKKYKSFAAWPRRERFLFLFGAVVPDIPVVAVGLYELAKYLCGHPQALQWHWIENGFLELLYRNENPKVANYLYAAVGYYHSAIFLRQCLHSVFFWATLVALLWPFARLRRNALIVSCGAIFFHILIDWPTHTIVAHNYFWPITIHPVRGFISHDNPWLLRTEIAIWMAWLASAIWRIACVISKKIQK